MKLEVGKSYRTRHGEKARVICIDADRPNYPVVALRRELASDVVYEMAASYTATGDFLQGTLHDWDLVSPGTDLKEGQLVFVGDPKHMTLVRRFVSMNDDGSHNVLADFGKPEVWNNCRAVTPEDLK